MTFVTKKYLSRRTALRGLGVSVLLPLLDSMVPAQTPTARTAAKPRLRMGLCFMPHGGVMANWTPVKRGANFKLSRTLTPLAPYQDQVVVISNLAHQMAAPAGPGDNGGDANIFNSIKLAEQMVKLKNKPYLPVPESAQVLIF